MKRYIIAISGASGSIYGIRLLEELLNRDIEVHIIVSQPAYIVMEQELNWQVKGADEFSRILRERYPKGKIYVYSNDDIAAPPASGSFLTDGMVIIPCSMATMSGIAVGNARSLMERTADVMLKEKRSLLIVPRETPLSTIHLRNMLTLSEAGAHLIPAMPAFYHHPGSIDDMVNFVVGKVMDLMHLEHDIFQRYDGNGEYNLPEV